MAWTSAATEIAISASICMVLIIVRCGYRILSNCERHLNCHRTWHSDDAWMAFGILPLAARSVTIAVSFSLALHPESQHDYVASRKFLIPGRLMYALFLWCMKFCLLSFYSRFENGSATVHRAVKILWYFMVVTFITCFVATLAPCRPLSIFWGPEPPNDHSCWEGKPNLLTTASLNLVTDLMLILFPIPILWRITHLTFWVKAQLTLLFGVGIIVVAVTITRIPLILDKSFSQATRTLWASIEIVVACVVANAAFYYALLKDVQSNHNENPARRPSAASITLRWIQEDDHPRGVPHATTTPMQSTPSSAELPSMAAPLAISWTPRRKTQSPLATNHVEKVDDKEERVSSP